MSLCCPYCCSLLLTEISVGLSQNIVAARLYAAEQLLIRRFLVLFQSRYVLLFAFILTIAQHCFDSFVLLYYYQFLSRCFVLTYAIEFVKNYFACFPQSVVDILTVYNPVDFWVDIKILRFVIANKLARLLVIEKLLAYECRRRLQVKLCLTGCAIEYFV